MKKTEKIMKLADIHVNPDNPRTATAKQIESLRRSIREFPEMTQLRPIVVDENNMILGGNMRYQAMKLENIKESTVVQVEGLTEEQKREFIIKDNVAFGDWDWDALANSWNAEDLDSWGLNTHAPKLYEDGTLGKEFIVPPFTILDTRRPAWQRRKKAWGGLVGDSSAGRAEALTINTGSKVVKPHTSTFDPVLCEIMLRWFGKKGGRVLDPFAGGSVRGVVAGALGLEYFGNDLSREQIDADVKQSENAAQIFGDGFKRPTYHCGDSLKIDDFFGGLEYDMLMTCPPYADLEKYTDNPADLSNMDYGEFLEKYRTILRKSAKMLAPSSFAVVVVGEVRDKKTGEYRNFVGDTVAAMKDAGLKYYNHAILVDLEGPAGPRAKRNMRTRKLTHTHQNILVGLKGEPASKERVTPAQLSDFFNESAMLEQRHLDIEIFTNVDSVKEIKKEFLERGII